MTTIEAYYFTLEKVNEIKESGVSTAINSVTSKNDTALVEKFNTPNSIPPKYWVNVSFEIESDEQALKIHESANYLGLCGIRFDMGGTENHRDWELDWSFFYQKGEENAEWKAARNKVEKMIRNI
ncbi:MAG: hypothetical protein COW67_08285 [Flavobacteriales bacterium CG18_big_fil_WC_8_21_14_2_50_32_9]|nr:hypothetical protein [Bacteroidota bacterium]PIQ15460.1 MAG: hypothetical protein COW67_08285 [Flavobacteriales bacterium CG18_big_fil_WC_8_21_14_2_50_32_9]